MALLALGGGLVTPAQAAVVSCGRRITKSITLNANVGPCPGDGIVIGADNITLNLGGHTVSGISAMGNSSAGVRLQGRTGVSVTNGTVSGFDAGVAILRGSKDLLTHLTIRDNIGIVTGDFCDGVFIMNSPDDQLSSSTISHNGPCEGVGVFGAASTGDVISGNTIEDQNVPQTPGGSLSIDFGISLGQGFDTWPSHATIKGNVVRNNDGDGINACSEFGNPCVTTDDAIVGNVVTGNGFYFGAQGPPAGFGGNGIRVVANDFAGNQVFVTRILVKGNVVTDNADGGIFVSTQQNRIVGNFTANNDVSRDFFALDLKDLSNGEGPNIPPCDSNIWSGNTWGPYYNTNPSFDPVGFTNLGSYNPECVSANGSGPRPGAAASFPPPAGAQVQATKALSASSPDLTTPRRNMPAGA